MTRTTLTRAVRNSLLAAHIVLSVSLLGDVLALAAVTLRAIGTDDVDTARVSFETMSMFSLAFGIPLSLGSLVTGVLLGRGTRWGVFRYWWVIGKLTLILAVIVVGAFVIGPAEDRLLDTPLSDSSRSRNQAIVLAGGLFDIGALLTATGLSVFKPGGPRQRMPRTRAGSAASTKPDKPVERRDFVAGAGAVALLVITAQRRRLPFGIAGVSAAGAHNELADWISEHATPLARTASSGSIDDLAPIRRWIGDTTDIVGLGESVHGAAEEITLKHRTLRLLVEQMGFRSVAWEDDWTIGLQVNEYISTGDGDLDALMSDMGSQWQCDEVADVLRWLREYNAAHDEMVQFVGVEYYLTRSPAYDSVEAYVAEAAPEQLAELRRHLDVVRPAAADIYEHVGWYMSVEDKQPYIDHARDISELLSRLPRDVEERAHDLALHHARQIVSFYEHYDLSDADALVYRDARTAENLKWWHQRSGDRIAYWAATPHTANAPGTAHRHSACP